MSKSFKSQLREVMNLAWSFIRKNGYSLSEALKIAWANIKLRALLNSKVVEFYFRKVDGSIRQAFGTLKADRVPEVHEDNRKKSDAVQVYFDTEKSEWRCFKKCNLIKIA